jgi:hypothetical protein
VHFENKKYISSVLKNALAYYNAGDVVVNLEPCRFAEQRFAERRFAENPKATFHQKPSSSNVVLPKARFLECPVHQNVSPIL